MPKKSRPVFFPNNITRLSRNGLLYRDHSAGDNGQHAHSCRHYTHHTAQLWHSEDQGVTLEAPFNSSTPPRRINVFNPHIRCVFPPAMQQVSAQPKRRLSTLKLVAISKKRRLRQQISATRAQNAGSANRNFSEFLQNGGI